MKKINRLITYFLAVAMLLSSAVFLSSCIGTPSSTESDHLGAPSDTSDTGGDENSYPKWDIGEEELEEIYQRALTSKKNKEYQYAHALFSLLARKNYKDSADLEKQLVSFGSATPFVSNVEMKNVITDSVSKDKGVLYISDGGKVKYAYIDQNGEVKDVVADPNLSGVISIFESPYNHGLTPDSLPYYYLCLKSDGKVEMLYNRSLYNGDEADDFKEYASFISNLSGVKQMMISNEGQDSAFLHEDGSITVWYKRSDSTNEQIKMQSDEGYVFTVFVSVSAFGIKTDGSVTEKVLYQNKDWISLHADYSYLSEQNIKIQSMYSPYEMVIDGKSYLLTSGNLPKPNAYTKVVISKDGMLVDVDGKISWDKIRELPSDNIKDIAYILSPSTFVTTEGKIMTGSSYEQNFDDEEKIFSNINIYLP